MAIIAPATDDIGTGFRINPASGDVVIVRPGIVVGSTDSDAINALGDSDVRIRVDGTVASEENAAVALGPSNTLTVGPNGAVIGERFGLFLAGGGSAVDNQGSITGGSLVESSGFETAIEIQSTANGTVIANAGSILGLEAGIVTAASSVSISNTGSISATLDAIRSTNDVAVSNSGTITSSTERGVEAIADGVSVSNSGSVTARHEGIFVEGQGGEISNEGTVLSTTSDGITVLAGDNTVIANTGNISAAGFGITLTGQGSVTNSGTISASGRAAIFIDDNFAGPTLVQNDGVLTSPDGFGITISGTSDSVLNTGSITSDLDAIRVSSIDAHVTNSGDIVSESAGINLTRYGTVINSGTIFALFRGITVDSASGAASEVINSGEIVASLQEGVTLNTGDMDARFINDGRVATLGDLGVDFDTMSATAKGTLRNDGTIAAGEGLTAVSGHNGDNAIRNSGTIDGNVVLEMGADTVSNSGAIFGDVVLGEGDDVYKGLQWGATHGTVTGDQGTDTLIGSMADDTLVGGIGDDLLRGRGGNDDLQGGGGVDTVRGGDGDDLMSGGGRGDVLIGNKGNDSISGDSGNDVLRGGDGHDTMDGGAGSDDLRGWGGDDSLIGGDGNDDLSGGKG
ncbi:MAG: calcium-binding protein, partial [Pseudomonadota bacterium]